jgi:hypothetical protein
MHVLFLCYVCVREAMVLPLLLLVVGAAVAREGEKEREVGPMAQAVR